MPTGSLPGIATNRYRIFSSSSALLHLIIMAPKIQPFVKIKAYYTSIWNKKSFVHSWHKISTHRYCVCSIWQHGFSHLSLSLSAPQSLSHAVLYSLLSHYSPLIPRLITSSPPRPISQSLHLSVSDLTPPGFWQGTVNAGREENRPFSRAGF